MFYIGYHNEHYAQIGLARSKDGITNWERSSLNPTIAPDENAWDGEACYKPFVLQIGSHWCFGTTAVAGPRNRLVRLYWIVRSSHSKEEKELWRTCRGN